ncbi:hypothetical protein WJX72_001750 [[Myrmecia] bisecta]|uniref:PHD-type domain-containing protein n=1 Tax=[Myrmecia] bisecta TaxID=41462 RepID=A0AAW1PKR4_9CHLO
MQPPFISTHSAVAAARHGPAQWAGRRSEPAVPNVKLNDGRRPLAAQATQAASQQTDAPSGNDARQPSNWQSSQADLSSPDDGGRQLADDDLGSPTHTAPTIGDTTHAEIRAATTRVVEALNRARAERIQRERSQDLSESDDEMIDVVNGDEAEEGADANGSADRDQEADAAGEEEIGEDTGLATNEIPEGEEDVGPVTEAAVREAIAGTDVVAIICNGNKGRLVVDDSTVVCLCRGCQTKARRQGKPWVEMTPTEFEKHSGMGASKKWRYTVKVDDGTPGGGQSIGAFLEKRGVPPEAKGLKPGRRKKRKYGFHTRGAPGSQLPSRSATPPLEAMLALGEDLDPTLTSTGEHWLQTSTEKGHQVNEVKAVMREGPEFQAVISPMLPAKKTSEAEEALAGLPGPTELEALALAAGREREEAMKLPPDAIMDPVALKRMSSQPLLLERGQRTRRKPQWLNNLSAIRQKRSIRTALSRGTSMHPNGRRGSRPLDADSDSSEDALPRWGRMPAKRIRSETRLSDDEMGVPPKRMRSMHDLGSLGPQVPVSRALSSLLAGRGGGRGRRLGLAGAPRPASSDAALAAAGDEMRDVSLQPSISSWQPVGGAGSVLQVSIMYKGRMFSGTLTQQARSKRGLTSPYAPGVLSSRASPSPHNPPALELLAAASDALGAHLDDELDVLPRRPYGSRRTGEAQPASRPLSREASVDLSEDPTNGWAEAPSEEDTWEVQGARGAAPASTTAATVGNPERRAAAEREYQRLEASGAPEGTRCALCHRGVEPGVPNTASVASPGRKGQGLGGLVLLRVSAIQHAWVHDQCAWWSPEVYGREGKLYGVPEAVRRGRMIKCRVCGQKGATLGCHMRNCRPSFHLPCARENGCLLQMDPYQALNQAMRSGEMLREHLGREVQPGELAPQPHSKVASANIGDILHAHIRNIRGGAEAGAQHSAQHSGPPANVPSWRDPRNPQPAGGAPFVRPSLQRHPSAPLPASSHAAQYPYVQPAPPQPSLEPQPSWNSSDEEDADTARQASLGMPIVEQHAPSGYASDGDMNALVNAQMPASHPLPSRPYQPGYGPPADSRPRFYEQQPGAAARRLNGGAGDLRSDPRSDPRTAGRGPGGPSRVPSGPIRAGPAPLSRPSTAGQQSGELPSDDETRSDMGGGNVSPQLATALSALTPSPMTLDAEKLMEAINSGQLVKSALDPDMAVVDSLLQSLLGGTVGKSSHRPGRCAVCVVQRKGKCGTESAPRKCLRKQALIKCGIFVETNNPRARYVQGQPGAGLSEIAAAAAAAAARAATAKREPSALERDARLAREAEIRQQRLQLDRQLMQQQQAAQAQAGSQAGLWPGSAQPRVAEPMLEGVLLEALEVAGPMLEGVLLEALARL